MTALPEVLEVIRLELSELTATVHAMSDRATLEMFLTDGQLLYVGTSNRLEPPGLRAAWTAVGSGFPVLVTVGTAATQGSPLPLVTYRRRGLQVRARLYRAGRFWLAEAAGSGLSVEVDNGSHCLTARSRRRAGSVRLRQSPSRLARSIDRRS